MLRVWPTVSNKTKKKKKKKERGLLFSFIAFLIFLAIPILFGTTPTEWSDYYYKLFPHAGVAHLEQAYKNSFDDSFNTLDEANTLVGNAPKTVKTATDLEAENAQLENYFSQRVEDYKNMIALDKKALGIHVPQAYQTFYQKRLAADTTDYQGFLVYRATQEKIMTATQELSIFETSYDTVTHESEKILGQRAVSKTDMQVMSVVVEKATLDYQKIAGDADTTGNFSQGLLTYIQKQYDLIAASQQIVDGYGTHNDAEIAQAAGIFEQAAQNPSPASIYDLINEWSDQMFGPALTQQDDLHNKATGMYSDAYSYATSQHLTDIVKVWGKSIPIQEKEYTPKTASPYQT